MTIVEFNRHIFTDEMGFTLKGNPEIHKLIGVNFKTGACRDEYNVQWELYEIEKIVLLDGRSAPVKETKPSLWNVSFETSNGDLIETTVEAGTPTQAIELAYPNLSDRGAMKETGLALRQPYKPKPQQAV